MNTSRSLTFKMAEHINKLPLSTCKIIETRENGKITLLQDNLDQLLQYIGESTDVAVDVQTPIALVSVTGPPQSGKSFYTNVLIEYLKYNGVDWTKDMMSSGLRGFPYGPVDNRVGLDYCQYPELEDGQELSSGIYFLPQMFSVHTSSPKLLWILHVVHGKLEAGADQHQDGKDPLDMFVGVACSRILDIVCNGMSVMESLQTDCSTEATLLSPHLCPSILHLRRGDPTDLKSSCQNKIFSIKKFSAPLHDRDGIVRWKAAQQLTIGRLIRNLLDETELLPNFVGKDRRVLNRQLINFFLNNCVELVNSRRGFASEQTLEAPDSIKNTEGICVKRIDDNHDHRMEESEESIDEASVNLDVADLADRVWDITLKSKDGDNGHIVISMDGNNEIQTVPDEASKREALENESLTRFIWPALTASLENWISANLNRDNFGEISVLFDKFLEDRIATYATRLPAHMVKGFSEVDVKGVLQESNLNVQVMKKHFITLEKALSSFCVEIESTFHDDSLSNSNDLKKIFKHTIERTTATIRDSKIRDLFETGAAKLIPYYEHLNLQRVQAYQIRHFYHEEMAEFAPTNQIVSPKTLTKVHECLIQHLLLVYKQVVDKSEDVLNMEETLGSDFLQIEENNMRMLEMAQKTVRSLILKLKSEYEIQVYEILEGSSEGMDIAKFEQQVTTIEEHVIEKFKGDLINTFPSETEAVDTYLTTLKAYLKKSGEIFRKEYKEKLNESEHQDDEQSSSQGIIDNNEINPSFERTRPREPSCKITSSCSTQLIVQLGNEKIGIGKFSDNSVVSIKYISPEIALTNDKEWVYGAELANLKKTSEILIKEWHVGTCFLSMDYSSNADCFPINFNQKSVQITPQFLLALVLRNEKDDMERELDEKIVTVKITVPFFFSSNQRQMVLDAAHLAGFTDAIIINENSAAAYHMYESCKADPDDSVCVIAENSEIIDISLYAYSNDEKTLSMLGHYSESGASIISAANDRSWFRFFGQIIRRFSPFTSPELRDGDELTSHKIIQLCQCTITQAKNRTTHVPSTRHFLITCHTEKWNTILSKVANTLSSPTFVTTDSYAPITGIGSIIKSIRKGHRKTVKELIWEQCPFFVTVCTPDDIAFKSGWEYEHGQRPITYILPKKDFFIISEEHKFLGLTHKIAELRIPYLNYKCNRVSLTLERSDGVVKVHKIESLYPYKKKTPILYKDWEWKKLTFMTDEDKNKHALIINELIIYSNKLVRIAKEKQLLSEKIGSMKKTIENGRSILTSILKQLVLKELTETMEGLSRPDIKESDMVKVRDFIDKISTKYQLAE